MTAYSTWIQQCQNAKKSLKNIVPLLPFSKKDFCPNLELFDEFESVINISKQKFSNILLAAICQEENLKVTERDKRNRTKFDVIKNKTSGC